MILIDHLLKRSGEIADQAAADAAGIHLVDLNTGFLHKPTVDANLAKFVLDQHKLLSGIRLFDELFN